MHGIGANREYVCPRALQTMSDFGHNAGDFVPIALMLQGSDFGEVERSEYNFRGMESAQPGFDCEIELFIIDRGAFPTCPADQSHRFHLRLYSEKNFLLFIN